MKNSGIGADTKKETGKFQSLYIGRDDPTRTDDPYVPNVVRYQLRYIPISGINSRRYASLLM